MQSATARRLRLRRMRARRGRSRRSPSWQASSWARPTPPPPPPRTRSPRASSQRGRTGTTPRCTSNIDLSAQRELSVSDFAASLRARLGHGHRHAPAGRGRTARRRGSPTAPSRREQRCSRRARARAHAAVRHPLHAASRCRSWRAAKSARVAWSRSLLFPGLRAGEQLTRDTDAARRARRCWRATARRSPAARPARRASAIRRSGATASAVVGSTGPIPASARARRSKARGCRPTRSSG